MRFDGTWNVTIVTPIGKQQVTLELASRESRIHGTARSAAETVEILDATLDPEGRRLTWTQHVTKPLRLTLRFDVVLDAAGTMTGTAKAGILPTSKLTGVRVVPGP